MNKLKCIFISFFVIIIITSCGEIGDNSDISANDNSVETNRPIFNVEFPDMSIVYYLNDTMYEITAFQGASSWTIITEDGSSVTSMPVSLSPIQAINELPMINRTVNDEEIILWILSLDVVPDAITARRWNVNNLEKAVAQHSYDFDYENYEDVDIINNSITVPYSENEYVYEITASWFSDDNWNFVKYSFCVANPIINDENMLETDLKIASTSGFIGLSYLGVVRFMDGAVHYDVWHDQLFISNVWNVLNYERWEVVDDVDYMVYLDNVNPHNFIYLTFYDNDMNPHKLVVSSVDVASNENGWSGVAHLDEFEVIYYIIPTGTFELIYNLLTEYTLKNTNPEINLDIIRAFSQNKGVMRFSYENEVGRVIFRYISRETLGDFVAGWEIERWEPYIIDWETADSVDNTMSSAVGFGSIEGSVGINRIHISLTSYIDAHIVYIGNWSGVNVYYSIPDSAFQTIKKQFESFKEMGTER